MRALEFVLGVVKNLGVLWMTSHCALSASWAYLFISFGFHVCACVQVNVLVPLAIIW